MSAETKTDKQKEKDRGLLLFWIILGSLIAVFVFWVLYHLSWETVGETSKLKWSELYGRGFPEWRKWGDWFYAGLAGALLYALVNVAHWYHQDYSQFRGFTLWYISTILKGPILAFIILLFLTTVDIEVAGLSINFSELDNAALLVAAFMLGFYNRVARETLNLITKSLFGKAYGRAEEKFSITPGNKEIIFGKNHGFKLTRATDVTWLASLGKIDDAGLYTAPAAGNLKSGTVDQITAVPKDANIPRATATIRLRNFKIVGDDKVAYEGKSTYTVKPTEAVTWSSTIGTISADKGEFIAPKKDDVDGQNSVIITATKTADTSDQATFKISLTE